MDVLTQSNGGGDVLLVHSPRERQWRADLEKFRRRDLLQKELLRKREAQERSVRKRWTTEFLLLQLPEQLIATHVLCHIDSLAEWAQLMLVSKQLQPHLLSALREVACLDLSMHPRVPKHSFTKFAAQLLNANRLPDGSIAPLPNLHSLRLTGCQNLDCEAVAFLLQYCPHVDQLWLDGTKVEPHESRRLAHLPTGRPKPVQQVQLGVWTDLHQVSGCMHRFREELPHLVQQMSDGAARYVGAGDHCEGIHLQAANEKMLTPLLVACHNGVCDAVQFYCENGVACDTPDCYGVTGLMKASYFGYSDIVAVLLAYGSSTRLKDMYGVGALAKAACRGHCHIVQMLIAASAPVEMMDMYGNRPLMAAASAGAIGTTELLCMAGADVNAQDGKGRTALMRALARGHKEVACVLVKFGARVPCNAVDTMCWQQS